MRFGDREGEIRISVLHYWGAVSTGKDDVRWNEENGWCFYVSADETENPVELAFNGVFSAQDSI